MTAPTNPSNTTTKSTPAKRSKRSSSRRKATGPSYPPNGTGPLPASALEPTDLLAGFEHRDMTKSYGGEGVLDWITGNTVEAQAMAERSRELRREVARRDVNEFIEYVGRDEETGKPLVQAPIHEDFQNLANVHSRLIVWAHIEAGKTQQFSVLRPLWLLGRDSTLRIAVISRTKDQAMKIADAAKNYIEKSEELHDVFPHLTPGKKWSSASFNVAQAVPSWKKDRNFQALGVGSAVLGARLDIVILDDVLDWTNTRTDEQRKAIAKWYAKQVAGRLTRRGRIIIAGNAWHPEDLMHALAVNTGVWFSRKFPVLDDKTGVPTWPEQWPADRIEKWKQENPTEWQRQLFCIAAADGDQRFKEEWIRRCLARGDGRGMPYALRVVPKGYRTYTGVDIGTRKTKKSGLTVLFTICVHPNGDREVLCVESGKWTGPEIVAKIRDVHRRYLSIVLVEDNAAQIFIQQFASRDDEGRPLPVMPFTTGKNKTDPDFGIESMAIELHNGVWIIPSKAGVPLTQEVAEWITEMLDYSRAAHTGDRLMASWFSREGSGRKKAKAQSTTLDLSPH